MKKTIYSCNICKEDKSPGQLIGINFSGMTKFKLGSAYNTDGSHICKDCLKQICEQAWTVGIEKATPKNGL